jgi:hypothetical protein
MRHGKLVCERIKLLRGAGDKMKIAAFLGEDLRKGVPNALRGTGNNHFLSAKLKIHCLSLPLFLCGGPTLRR